MTRFLRLLIAVACILTAIGIVSLSTQAPVQAQTGRPKAKPKPISPTELKKLDSKLEDVQKSFLKDTESIIRGYEEGGQFERAKILLEVLLKLDPKNEQIKKKLEQLDDQILDSSESDFDLDASKGWQQVGIVAKERLIRIEVEGDYKFVANLNAGPDGFPTKDIANDMANAPLGAVVATIVPPTGFPPPNAAQGGGNAGGGGGGGGNRGDRPGVFTVGTKFEQPANRDGILMLKVNVPPGSKCTGKLKVKVGGVSRST